VSDDPLREIGTFARDLVVQAGAGTGKTHALVTLYLHLVTGLGAREEAVEPARIVVITFTDTAAGELRERIRQRLGALLERGLVAEPTLEEAARMTGRAAPSPVMLRRIITELQRAPIGTFHGFGRAFLARHALAAGLSPGFSLLDEHEARRRAVEAARAVVIEAMEAGDEATATLVDQLGFHPQAKRGLVESLAFVRMVLADEGRAAHGIAGAYADGPLAVDRHEAARTLRRTLAAFSEAGDHVGDGSRPRVVRLAEAARSPAWDGAGGRELLVELRKEMGAIRARKGDTFLAPLREAFKDAADAFDEAEAAVRAAPLARAFERLLVATEDRYAAWKRAHEVADFADLIRLPRDLLRSDPQLARAEGAAIDALLVDEFQDTNRAQAELVELLADSVKAPIGTGRRFVVGDRKQSIYEFRGADVAVFTDVTSALARAGAGEVVLRRSFRSRPELVNAANAMFARAFGPVATSSWGLSFDAARDALESTRDASADAGVELLAARPAEGEPDDASALRRLEAQAIARRMRALVQEGHEPRELALLLRRYTHLDVYLEALRRERLPHYVVRGRGFYEAQEVRDLAALITWLHDPDDRFALAAVLRSPLCGLSDDGLAALAAAGELDRNLVTRPVRARMNAADTRALAALVERVVALRAVQHRLMPADLLREALDRFDLRAIWAGTSDGIQKIANLEHLVARADEMAADPRGPAADLPRFARWLERAVRPLDALGASGAQIVDERDDVVRVMTIHQAKGLEFPIVFVADCGAREHVRQGAVLYDAELGLGLKLAEPGAPKLVSTTPSRRVVERQTARQRAESLRLFYVAATRARDRVVFSGEIFDKNGGWRRAIDALADDAATSALISRTTPAMVAPIVNGLAPTREVDLDTLAAFAHRVPASALGLRVAVTQLQDFALCARRYQLFHELRLDEHPRARVEIDNDDEESESGDPLRSGSLAHRLLEHCTFGLGADESRSELDARLSAEGYAANDTHVTALRDRVVAFLSTGYARALGGRPLRRELPFALSLPSATGHARVIRGQIDLLAFSDDGIDVVDYKHARAGDLERYRFQLEAYALAARTLYPRAPRIRVGLSFLREADPTPVWLTLDDIESIESRLAALCERLAQARVDRLRPGIARRSCEAIRCGYLALCHGQPKAPQLELGL
jgi:ATP-dependent exoDNAse (exonuclease V) beta subunit